MHKQRSFIGVLILISIIMLLAAAYQPATTQENNQTIIYTVDRSAVPLLYFNDLTLIVNVGDAQNITLIDENGSAIPFQFGPESDEIIFSTAASTVRLNLEGVQPSATLGEYRKAPLKDNFLWAYSHGFDDNFGLDDTRNAFLERDVPATYNVVADWVAVIPNWTGDFTPAELDEILDAGWGLNNHTWDHETADLEDPNAADPGGCSDTSLTYEDRLADVLATQNRLEELIAASSRPDYFVTGFSIPCGGVEQMQDYPVAITEIRESGEKPILFYESGWDFPPYMDVSPPYDLEQDILRDGRIDGPNGQLDEVKAQIDEISNLARNNNTPYWYNSFSHGYTVFGDNTNIMAELLDYLLETYGRDGANEVWIAPSDEIYAYLAVRDKTVITSNSDNNATPVPTATASATIPISPTAPPQCNSLINGDFELGLQNWEEAGALNVVSGRTGNGMSLSNGFTTQLVDATADRPFTLSGYFNLENIDAAETGRWVGFGIDYLDDDETKLGDYSLEINSPQSGFVEMSFNAITVPGTTQVRIWVFSSNSTPFIFDDLTLEWDGCATQIQTPVPTHTPSPIPTLIQGATQTPLPTSTVSLPNNQDQFIFLPYIRR